MASSSLLPLRGAFALLFGVTVLLWPTMRSASP
jgi:hypothetical protein